MQIYSDPAREDESYSLPDVEVFYMSEGEIPPECGYFDSDKPSPAGYYWWPCFPGCFPDGEPEGPFETEAAAIENARDF